AVLVLTPVRVMQPRVLERELAAQCNKLCFIGKPQFEPELGSQTNIKSGHIQCPFLCLQVGMNTTLESPDVH
ncbi:MAG TPA: hypothetical protein VEA37_07935, partial [Flavobacterium sp.]|nr:hypothetical protein [Flavobacterium sp.]